MALTPAERAAYLASVTTAKENSVIEDTLQESDAARAEAAGVFTASDIRYADSLEAYASREDVENLASRRARDLAANPADQDFRRKVPTEPVPTQVDNSSTFVTPTVTP